MSFLAPGFLMAAAAAAIGVVALHFIVTRRPRSVPFPTARFVPDLPVAARSRSIQFSDLLLLAVRVLVILFAGAALARPVIPPQREKTVRVIVADVSGAVADPEEVRDSVRVLYRPGDALIGFDTAATPLSSPDSIASRPRSQSAGSLSAGLIAALRAGSSVRDGADSIELVVVSPIVTAEHDRATLAIRTQWPGRASVINVAAHAADSAASSEPIRQIFQTAGRPAFSVARNRIDTVGGVVSHGNVVVAQFERRWRFSPDSLAGAAVIARWVDGEPAAIERRSANSCARSVAIPMDTTGDMPLRPEVMRLRASLSMPCGYVASPPDTALAANMTGTGRLASTAAFPPASNIDSPMARWLAALAILLAIVEMVLRHAPDKEVEG